MTTRPILIISFVGRDDAQELAEDAMTAFVKSPLWKKNFKISATNGAIYESGMTVQKHNIAHAFLYGYWARGEAE